MAAPHLAAAPCPAPTQVPEDVKAKVEGKAKELKEAIPTDDVAKVGRPTPPPASSPLQHLQPRQATCARWGHACRPRVGPILRPHHQALVLHPLTRPPHPTHPARQIKAAMEELQKEVMSLGQAVYGQQGGAAPGADAGAGAGASGSGSSGPKAGGDDVIDAEFTDSK